MQFWPKYFIKKIINNQAPADPNMSAYDHFAHMYVNYLQSTVGVDT
jgi:hypothetical protein